MKPGEIIVKRTEIEVNKGHKSTIILWQISFFL